MTGLYTRLSVSPHPLINASWLQKRIRPSLPLALMLTLLVYTCNPVPTLRAEAADSLPPFIDRAVINASLQALQRHGADLSKAMPSHHRVECDSRDIAAEVSQWARDAGFDVAEPVVLRGHGGVPSYVVSLTKIGIPDANDIRQQGLEILDGVSSIDGATYVTWTGEIVR